jgi:hypothetical protein
MHHDKRLVSHAANLAHYLATSVAEFCHGLDDGWELWRRYGKDYPCQRQKLSQSSASLPRPAMARVQVKQPERVRQPEAIGSALS